MGKQKAGPISWDPPSDLRELWWAVLGSIIGINHASAPLSGIRGLIGSINSKTVTITTVHRSVRANAAGGFYAGRPGDREQWLQRYALGGMRSLGDIANGHRAQIAAGEPTRVWAEPETKGESCIPHANDWRRPGARSILEQTAGIMGGQVGWFERGGIRWSERRDRIEAAMRSAEAAEHTAAPPLCASRDRCAREGHAAFQHGACRHQGHRRGRD